MLSRIADIPGVEDRDLSSVDWILQGAAVMPQNLLRRWFELLSPERIVMAYGMTENLGLTALRGDEWLRPPRQRRTGIPRHRHPRGRRPRRRRRPGHARRDLSARSDERPVPLHRRRGAAAHHTGRLHVGRRHRPSRRRRLPVHRGSPHRHDRHRRRQCLSRRGGVGADRPSRHRRRRGDRNRRSAVGPPRPRRGSTRSTSPTP